MITVSRQKISICVQMWDNAKTCCKKACQKLVAMRCPGKPKVEKLYIHAKIRLSAARITKTRKLQQYFPTIVNICAYHGHKNRQKHENSMFSSIYIRDLYLAHIKFVQFVPRFLPRCPLYSFIICTNNIVIFWHYLGLRMPHMQKRTERCMILRW